MAEGEPLLAVRGLTTTFATDGGAVTPSDDVSFEVAAGEVVGLVGESGSGKSMTAKAILGLVEPRRAIKAGEIRFQGTDLLALGPDALRRRRGRDLAMIFQDPMASLNPLMRVGRQLTRLYLAHDDTRRSRADKRAAAKERALDLLRRVRIPDPEARFEQYPHQFSGGMRQRVMIAMALMCRPSFLVADEPTTALDATVELQVVQLIRELQEETGMAVLFISHNLTVIARLAHRVLVMYGGRIVESGPSEEVLGDPVHPYTQALLASTPRGGKRDGRLRPIAGEPPRLAALPPGCPFQPRCPLAGPGCERPQALVRLGEGHAAACHRVGGVGEPATVAAREVAS